MNEKGDVRAFPVIAASILQLLESASTPQTFSDLFREARANEPVCTACGERACAVSGSMETVSPVLVVNLTWMETPSSSSIAQLVKGALLPFSRLRRRLGRHVSMRRRRLLQGRPLTSPTRGRLHLRLI